MMMGSSLSARLWRRPRVGLEILITMLPMLTFLLTLISTWSWTLIKRYWCWRRRWRRGYNYVVLNYITNVECLSIRWFTFTCTPEGEECVSTQAGDKNKDCNSETPIVLGETICGISSTYFREDGSARSDIGSGSLWKLPPLQFQSILKLAFKSSSVPLSSNGDLGARDGQVCPGICHRSWSFRNRPLQMSLARWLYPML